MRPLLEGWKHMARGARRISFQHQVGPQSCIMPPLLEILLRTVSLVAIQAMSIDSQNDVHCHSAPSPTLSFYWAGNWGPESLSNHRSGVMPSWDRSHDSGAQAAPLGERKWKHGPQLGLSLARAANTPAGLNLLLLFLNLSWNFSFPYPALASPLPAHSSSSNQRS